MTAGPNPSGLCMCGCGQRTPTAKASNRARGLVRGTPIRFIHGHNANASECVHHIDLDRSNNTADNLVVLTRSEHMAIHRRITSGMEPRQALTEVLG